MGIAATSEASCRHGASLLAFKEHPHKWRIILLLIWTLAILWVRPWTGDLRSDPLRYACIAKDMVENNHWFSPMLDGEPYLNKPPLYFWFVAASFKLFGVSTYAAKIPSLLFATICVLFFYWVAFRLFRDHDLAFFSALALLTTRWIYRNFATNRPESLFLFSLLLGVYALILMKEHDAKGPYLMGLSFALGFLTKAAFGILFPSVAFLYSIATKRLLTWLRWPHFSYGCALGVIMTAPWFVYYETTNPGSFAHLVGPQTVQRITEGADVNKDPYMYAKEFAIYYHPYLVFFALGFGALMKRLKQETYFFIFLSLLCLFIPLQLATGKSDRYLTVITPFLSIVTALGILKYEKVKRVANKVAAFGIIPLLIFFWVLPFSVHSEKFSVLHFAERLSAEPQVDYKDLLAPLGFRRDKADTKVRYVEWAIPGVDRDYRLANYLYLPARFERWSAETMSSWVRDGGPPILLLTSTKSVPLLPQSGVKWLEINSDKSHALLVGVTNRL